MGRELRGTRLVAARGWSRHGQSVMRTREGTPELVGLYLAEWRREQWLGPDLVPVFERARWPTGRLWWLVGPSPELPSPRAHASRPPVPSAPVDPHGAARPGSWAEPDGEFLATLPVGDPPHLLAGLLSAHPPTRFVSPVDQVAGVLSCGRYPESVVAALVDALATDETVSVVDDVADLWGRPCRALRHENGNGATHELLLDRSATSYRGPPSTATPASPSGYSPLSTPRTTVGRARRRSRIPRTPPPRCTATFDLQVDQEQWAQLPTTGWRPVHHLVLHTATRQVGAAPHPRARCPNYASS